MGALGVSEKVDLLSVVKKLGTWTRTAQQQAQTQQQQQAAKTGRPALLALLGESTAVHRLVMSGPLQAGTTMREFGHGVAGFR